MKFLCPSCKAKYQIADEKVAGRSVRMKCRKCGYVISIAKAVTEGSVSRKLEGLSSRPPGPASAPPAPNPAPQPPPGAKSPPPRPGGGWREPGAITKPNKNPFAKPTPGGGIERPPPSRPPPPRRFGGTLTGGAPPKPAPSPEPPAARAAPRPAAGAPPRPAVQRPGRTEPIGTRDAAALIAKPGLTEPVGGVGRTPGSEPYESPTSHRGGNGASRGNGAYSTPLQDEDRTMIAGLGALADAFSESVAGPDSSALVASLASTDEWYVGINGVPVGPIRLSELRSKASSGAIGIDSLVWREGFEQWLPLSNFPELVAIVEEGLSSAYASPGPLAPPPSHPVPPAAPRPEVYDPFRLPGDAPLNLNDPFASPASSVHRPTSPSHGITGITPTGGNLVGSSSPFGPMVAPPTGGPMVIAEKTDERISIPQRRGTSIFAWVAVAIALMLGLTIGFVMFARKTPETVVKYVEVPAKSGETAQVAPSGSAMEVTIEVAAPDGGTMRVAKGGPLPTKPGEKPEEKPLTGLSGLSGLQGGGPTTGPGGGTTTSGSSNQALDSGQIQQTVGKYTGSVKRSCWQPALDSRSKDAPTSARVSVSITVGPSGSVQSVSTSGDPKGYPGLSSCIASRVKAWQFPASNGTTTVNVPFVFAAQ